MSESTCRIDKCLEPVRCMRLCKLHYNRWLVSGKASTIDPSPRKFNSRVGKICDEPHCNDPVRSRGLCALHYGRARYNPVPCPQCGGVKSKAAELCVNCRYAETLERPEFKECTSCHIVKAQVEFGWRKDGRGASKLRSKCRACASKEHYALKQAQLARDPEKLAEKIKAAKAREAARERALDPDERIRRSLRLSARHLGLDPELVLARYDVVGNRCEACQAVPGVNEKRVAVDHCHRRNVFRGLLCHECNLLLGMMESDYSRVVGVMNYHDKYRDI